MNRLLLFVLAISMSASLYAQERYETKYGLRLAVNYSNLSSDDAIFNDADSRIAPAVTFFAEIPLGNTFSLVPELGFSALGVKQNDFTLANGDIVELKTNWLQATLLAQINFTDNLYLVLGPQGGINISENDDNDYYNFDVLAVGGLGVRITQNFSIDARYGYGFGNVFDNSLSATSEANNRYYQLGVAYRM